MSGAVFLEGFVPTAELEGWLESPSALELA